MKDWGTKNDKRNCLKRGFRGIDLWGLKSNCNGIVFPPISSMASKLLIDRREMRPPIPGAHPAVTVQDGYQEEGEITHCMWGPFLFCRQSQSQSQIPRVGSRLVPQLNKIISFWLAWPLIKLLNICKGEKEGEHKKIYSFFFFIRLFMWRAAALLSVKVADVYKTYGTARLLFNFMFSLQEARLLRPRTGGVRSK